MSEKINEYVKQQESRFLEELKDFLRIPSISTLPEHDADVRRAAEFTAASLRAAGMENVEVIATAKHPLVYGPST